MAGETAELEVTKDRITEDVRALIKLHLPERPSFTQQAFGPSRTGNLDNPFDLKLYALLERGGLQLVRVAVSGAAEPGQPLRASEALAIVERTYSFLADLWRGTGFSSVLPIMLVAQGSHEFCRLRHTLAQEVNRLLTSPAKNSDRGSPGKCSRAALKREFPNRALWLKRQMADRKWSKAMLNQHGGPDRKTVEKILQGYRVRESTLETLAKALSTSRKGGTIDPADIPED